MLVSIVVPVYNTEKYLERCVESIICQSHEELEILLIDDGSTDMSSQLCDDFSKKDSRIQVIHRENGGLSAARNSGIEKATGKYISFIDSDDYIADTFIEELLELCMDNDAQIAQCGYMSVDDESMPLPPVGSSKPRIYDYNQALTLCCDYSRSETWINNIAAWNKLYDVELFSKMRYPEGKIHEDEFLTYRLKWEAKKTAVIERCLYYYYRRVDSISGADFSPKNLDKLEAFEEREKFLKKLGKESEYRRTLLTKYKLGVNFYNQLIDGFAHEKEMIRELKEMLDEAERVISTWSGLSMIDRLRILYPRMDGKQRADLERETGKIFFSGENGILYIFPFHLVEQGSRVLIYGAGKVGQDYYRQIVTSNRYKLVDWVDLAWKERKDSGLPVNKPDCILCEEYDYLIIANANKDISSQIKSNLVEWGVSEEKIISNPEYVMPLFKAKSRNSFIKTVLSNSKKGGRIFLMNTPEHNNLGDHALALACAAYLKDKFHEYGFIEVTGPEWDMFWDRIVNEINKNDIIFIVGGGFMGDLWQNEDKRVKDIVRKLPQNKIILLPQTFYYEEKNNIESDRLFYRAQDNLMVIHREKNSKEFFSDEIDNDLKKTLCFPDMALYLKPDIVSLNRNGAILCFRKDKESVLSSSDKEYIENELIKAGYDVTCTDTVLHRNVSKEEREAFVNKKIKEFSQAKIVVTDRLHGMIFSYLAQTPCIVFDNSTKKVTGVLEWIRDDKLIKVGDINKFDTSSVEADRAYNDSLKKSFDEMTKNIRTWIK